MARAQAETGVDFDPTSTGWNGLSGLLEVAREVDVSLEIVDRLDVGTLQSADAVLLISPAAELPAAGLTEFMRAGGRVALADDFAEGDSLLRTFRIGRGRPNRAGAMQLRGNEELLIARPASPHPLTEGVSALVTNHAQVVYHQDLEPIFSFGPHDAVVLAGAVGSGRLVTIGDSSVLINNMLELRGNRRFAANLLAYLHGDTEGRVILVPPTAVVVGRFGEPGADRPLHDLRALIERLSAVTLPPMALRIAGASLAAILLVLAAGLLPRRSPYVGASMFARDPVPGGFVGRVAWFAAHRTNLVEPLMVYKLELETELHRRLGLVGRATLSDVAEAMKARRMSSEEVGRARMLLVELHELYENNQRGTAEAVTEARFREVMRRGEALRARLGDLVAPPSMSEAR